MAWLTREQIAAMGFAAVGEKVYLSDKASYYRCAAIRIGNHVRVDDFCVLSAGEGGILLGNYLHIAVYSLLIGAGRIVLSDYCNISSRVAVYSSNDDYSGLAMTNPMVPAEFTAVTTGDVFLGRHVIVGSGSVILPGVSLGDGVAIGALSLVKHDCAAFGMYAGVPVRRVRERKRDLLELEKRLQSRAD
jgi:galactoside O-acetyltransferase